METSPYQMGNIWHISQSPPSHLSSDMGQMCFLKHKTISTSHIPHCIPW